MCRLVVPLPVILGHDLRRKHHEKPRRSDGVYISGNAFLILSKRVPSADVPLRCVFKTDRGTNGIRSGTQYLRTENTRKRSIIRWMGRVEEERASALGANRKRVYTFRRHRTPYPVAVASSGGVNLCVYGARA